MFLAVFLVLRTVVVLVRLRNNRVLYEAPPPKVPGTRGAPRKHGPQFKLANPSRPPDLEMCFTIGQQHVHGQVWYGLHFYALAALVGSVLRIEFLKADGTPRYKRPLWLFWTGNRKVLPTEVCRMYLWRFAIEHAFRFLSSVYVDDVSGLVKTWMDRLAYLCHRPALGGKCAYPLATVGGSATSHTLRTMNAALLTWGYHLVGQTGLKMGALASADELPRYQPAAIKVADKLYHAVAQKQALNPAFVSLLAFKVQQLAWQHEPPGSYDYAYWQARGWLAPDCTFYATHRAGVLKVTLARWVGTIVHRFVT